MDQGVDFILLSSHPRIAYSAVPGSSLLEDARFAHGPLIPAAELKLDADPCHRWPLCKEEAVSLDEILRQSLDELGVEVCASLDHAMFEAMLAPSDVFVTLGAREIEALEGASLVSISNGVASWAVKNRLGELKDALSDALAANTEVQESVNSVFRELWVIERSIRRALRSRAKVVWGKSWRQQVLGGDLPAKVLERASVAAYAAAKSLAEIRDPIEWLTLGELLETRSRQPIGELGIESTLWTLFASEMLPIRNRLSHMRLMRSEDIPMVMKWARVMERKLEI
jgi:hypothetical protein